MILSFNDNQARDDFHNRINAEKPNAARYVYTMADQPLRLAVAAFDPLEGLWIKNNVGDYGGRISFMSPATEKAIALAEVTRPTPPYYSNGHKPHENGVYRSYTRPNNGYRHANNGHSAGKFAFHAVVH